MTVTSALPPYYPAQQSDSIFPMSPELNMPVNTRTSGLPWGDSALPAREVPAASKPLPSSVPQPVDLNALRALQQRPGAQLMRSSTLPLAAYALELAYPPSLQAHARRRCQDVLRKMNHPDQDPDQLFLKVFSRENPLIKADGQREYTRYISMTQLALMTLAKARFAELEDSLDRHERDPLAPDGAAADVLTHHSEYGLVAGAGFSCNSLRDAVRATDLKGSYTQCLKTFWAEHGQTYRALAKLAYASELALQPLDHQLSPDARALALLAAGLTTAAPTFEQLHESKADDACHVTSLRIEGRVIPGIVEIRSNSAPLTLIYIPGRRPAFLEFSTPKHAESGFNRLLEDANMREVLAPYLNAALNRASHVNDAATQATPPDLFDHLSAELLRSSVMALDLDAPQLDAPTPGKAANEVFQPIARSLEMLTSTGPLQVSHDLLKRLPSAKRLASQFMRKALRPHYPHAFDADHTFIKYLPGRRVEQAPYLLPKKTHVPDTRPVSVTQALLDNYRVDFAVGYKDYGARTVVFTDDTGQGIYTEGKELPIAPSLIATLVEQANFSRRFRDHMTRFWTSHSTRINLYLREVFNTHVIDSLAGGSLTRTGLAIVREALNENTGHADPPHMQAPGFKIDNSEQQTSAGLIQFSRPGTPLRVLYQPGNSPPFMQFANQAAVQGYLQQATRDPAWREGFLRHVPQRNHDKTNLILDIWAGKRSTTSTSLLRPWTDQTTQSHLWAARGHLLAYEALPADPFTFMANSLRNNSLDNARESITTNGQLSRRHWVERLDTLAWLLTPLALASPFGAAGLLVVGGSRMAIDLYTALSPESSSRDREQAVADMALGSLGLLPAAPRLSKMFKTLAQPSRLRGKSHALMHLPNNRATQPRAFFDSGSIMKNQIIPGIPKLGTEAVTAWKLGRKFLLWTGEKKQARTLIVSTHGSYLPLTGSAGVAIPNGTRLKVYAPHGYSLIDPQLSKVASGRVTPYATLDTTANTANRSAYRPGASMPSDKLMSGTEAPGHVRNYTLRKFQEQANGETYDDVSSIVRNLRLGPPGNRPNLKPVDVLTVRNRLGNRPPTLNDLFKELGERGIHYDEIRLVHCRNSLFNFWPQRYTAPLISNIP